MIDGFSIFNIQIKFYGLIIASAIVIGIFLCSYLCKKRGLPKSTAIDAALWAVPLAIICARIYYVIFSNHTYSFWEIFKVWEGGLAIYGAVIGGFLGLLIYSKINKKVTILELCDVFVPCVILGQALGRWGNFINQEAFGYEVTNPSLQWFPFAVFIDSTSTWHLATFFYESMWNLIVFAVLMVVVHKLKISGVSTCLYFVLYGIGRVVIEGLRTDSLYIGTSSIRVSQLLSGVLIFLGIILLVYILYQNKKHGKFIATGYEIDENEIKKVNDQSILLKIKNKLKSQTNSEKVEKINNKKSNEISNEKEDEKISSGIKIVKAKVDTSNIKTTKNVKIKKTNILHKQKADKTKNQNVIDDIDVKKSSSDDE